MRTVGGVLYATFYLLVLVYWATRKRPASRPYLHVLLRPSGPRP